MVETHVLLPRKLNCVDECCRFSVFFLLYRCAMDGMGFVRACASGAGVRRFVGTVLISKFKTEWCMCRINLLIRR